MRILNLEGMNFVPCMRELGHDVLCIGPDTRCDLQPSQTMGFDRLWDFLHARNFVPELVLWNDNCRPPSVLGFERLPCPTIGFSIDQYCNPWHVPFSAAFDLMLIAQKDYVSQFELPHLPRPCQWFPLFWRRQPDQAAIRQRDIPVSFVGTVEGSINHERKNFLQTFKHHHPIFITQGDYVPIFARSEVVLNQSAAGELNFRIFEAAACGALVLTEEAHNGLHDLFTPGEDILTYPAGDPLTAAKICRSILADNERLTRIAVRGYEKVLKKHSAMARTRTILLKARELMKTRAHDWRLSHQRIVNEELTKMLFFLGGDQALSMDAGIKSQFMHKGLAWLTSK